MARAITFVSLIIILCMGTASAQQDRPYEGLQKRAIKALSNEQIAELRAGQGIGLALAAELNGYPGPRHVLELAGPLSLTDDQRGKIQSLFSAMTAETVEIGATLIEQETDLDRRFATKAMTLDALASATAAIGNTQGALRNAHLKYHLWTLALLTPAQAQRYSELRGYAKDAGSEGAHGGHER